jgi:hypothetical protein
MKSILVSILKYFCILVKNICVDLVNDIKIYVRMLTCNEDIEILPDCEMTYIRDQFPTRVDPSEENFTYTFKAQTLLNRRLITEDAQELIENMDSVVYSQEFKYQVTAISKTEVSGIVTHAETLFGFSNNPKFIQLAIHDRLKHKLSEAYRLQIEKKHAFADGMWFMIKFGCFWFAGTLMIARMFII